jgi:hypothetical protein
MQWKLYATKCTHRENSLPYRLLPKMYSRILSMARRHYFNQFITREVRIAQPQAFGLISGVAVRRQTFDSLGGISLYHTQDIRNYS